MNVKELYGLFYLLLFMFISLDMTAQNGTGVYTHHVGAFSITTLPESQGTGNTKILIGITPEMQEKYLPDGTFPNAVNAFLVKTPDRTILIDAGFGRKLFDHLEKLNTRPDQVDMILLTHMHGDHIGGLLRDGKKTFPNAELYISTVEHDYWMKEGKEAQVNVINAYKSKLKLFDAQALNEAAPDLIPGVKAFAAYGHTPGHTAFLFESNGGKLFVWGDLTHAMKIQMPCPEIAVTYDVDPVMATQSRREVLKYVSRHKIPIAGMHIAFPGMGEVVSGQEGYIYKTFTP
jgi:glyoxylase-like metal-dependent hydrolase (beta-lactamase superfamily II)